MINTICFSRDRPAQLDLLLRSVALNTPWIDRVSVVYRASGISYVDGYMLCERHHPAVSFLPERDFRAQTLEGLHHGDYTVFLCDDDVIYRPHPVGFMLPGHRLAEYPEVLCVSLRLGQNTTECYSLRTHQTPPPTISYYPWQTASGDFSYPGSLDGHIFRTHQLRTLITANNPTWTGPNELEDHLHRATQTCLLPYMAAYPQSLLVGVPVNRTNTTHLTNRYGEQHPAGPDYLNRRFLSGDRLWLEGSIMPEKVNAAHVEFPLLWEPRKVAPGSPTKILQKKAGER